MKKLALGFMAAAMLMTGTAQAGVVDYLKEYGIPCAAGFAAGYLASKDHGGAIGLGVCAGVSAATYIQSTRASDKMREEDFKKFVSLMDEHSAASAADQDARVSKAIKEMEQRQEAQIEGIRQVMKEVIAERMALVADETKSDVKRYVEKADFMQDLEKKVMMRMKEEVQVESKIRQKEVVSQCVDESLRQLVLKKVGSPTE